MLIFLLAMGVLAAGCGSNEGTKTEEPEVLEESDAEDSDMKEKSDKTEESNKTEELGDREEAENRDDSETAEASEIERDSELAQESGNISTEREQKDETLVFAELKNVDFCFASGAGAWSTDLQIEADGSFSGVFHDSDMGDIGEGYPNGTYYYCEFEGKFTEPEKIDAYTYAMEIEEIYYANEPDTSEIIDEMLYRYTTAYGLDGAKILYLYLPNAPIEELPQEYMDWVRMCNDINTARLSFYGLYNVTEQNGFFSYDTGKIWEDYIKSIKEESDVIEAELEQGTLTQLEMNRKSKELYDLWDRALNYLWGELKVVLPEEEFTKLLEEQRLWIKHKEKVVEEEGKESEGGSIHALIVNMKAAELTKARVYELYTLLQK